MTLDEPTFYERAFEVCPECQGSGVQGEELEATVWCPHCDGYGEIEL